MSSLPKVKMTSMATRDITVDVLLERIQNNFRILRTGSIDEGELKQDLEDLVEGLKDIGQELMAEYEWLKELLDEIRSEERKALFLTQLQADHERFLRTRTRFLEVKGLVEGTENVVEVVYKITAARSLLGRLQSPTAQRSMSQSLSKISVAQEKVFDGRKGLVELMGEAERRGLEAKLVAVQTETKERMKAAQSAARSAVERLTKKQSPSDHTPRPERPTTSRTHATGNDHAKSPGAPFPNRKPSTAESEADAGTSDRTHADGGGGASAATSRIRPVQGKRRGETRLVKKPATPDASGVSRSDAQRAKRALNDWARWNPLAPVNLGDAVRIVKATPEDATLIRIHSLVGERKWRGELSRANGSPQLNKGESLWDLPASPPSQFTSATEESDYCETAYRARHLEHLIYSGDVPANILREASGKIIVQEDLSGYRNGVVELGLENRCIEALSKWASGNHEVGEHFKLGDRGGESGDGPATRLVRSSLHVESIPVVHLQCELSFRAGRHYLVEAWLCGDEGKLYLADVPKAWTWKTTAWLTAITTLGIPLGFLLASLVHG